MNLDIKILSKLPANKIPIFINPFTDVSFFESHILKRRANELEVMIFYSSSISEFELFINRDLKPEEKEAFVQ